MKPAVIRLAALTATCVLVGCANRPASLYMWESFPRQQYSALLREGGNPEEQIRVLEAHAEKARGANAALPPGFRAHLGLIHYGTGNLDQAKALWMAEKAAFPESSHYIDSLLRRMEPKAPSTTTGKENPA